MQLTFEFCFGKIFLLIFVFLLFGFFSVDFYDDVTAGRRRFDECMFFNFLFDFYLIWTKFADNMNPQWFHTEFILEILFF